MADRQLSGSPSLADIDKRLARIEANLDRLGGVLDVLPGGVAMAADGFDEMVANINASGTAVDERLHRVTRLVGELTEGRTLDALEQLVQVLRQVPDLPDMVAMMGDAFDELMSGLRAHGVDVEHTLKHIKTTRALRSQNLEFALTVAKVVGEAGETADSDGIGVWGLIKATRDPQVQRALAFLIDVAKRLGKELEQRNTKALPLLED